MKILFICGSLEPGRDGVGDYTRRLGGELIKQGHEVKAIALNDQHICEIVENSEEYKNIQFCIFRIPSILTAGTRFELAKVWIDQFNPHWISLQFVPFSFHRKGLSLNLGWKLAGLGNNLNWHVMLHELWVGMEKEASLKVVSWGILQKTLIQLLLKKLEPQLIHTQTELYQNQLNRIGFQAQLVPLFSNIPVPIHSTFFKETSDLPLKTNSKIIFTVFGAIQKGAPIMDFASELAEYSRVEGISVSVRFIGRSGSELNQWIIALSNEKIEVEVIGEISSKEISANLSSSSLGVSTTPLAQIEKSGTVAAMREHGLNVLVVARPWNPRGIDHIKIPMGITKYKKGNLGASLKFGKSNFKMDGVEDVARKLVNAFISKKNIK
jgi:hypothetical protein